MEQAITEINEVIDFYKDMADKMKLPEDYTHSMELADKIEALERTADILKDFAT